MEPNARDQLQSAWCAGRDAAADWIMQQVELDTRANGGFADHARNQILLDVYMHLRALVCNLPHK